MRRVIYSLSTREGDDEGLCPHQLALSVDSLRRHNDDIPVTLFLYGALPSEVEDKLAGLNVDVRRRGAYADVLRELTPEWELGAACPLLHKWLSLRALEVAPDDQVLYLDCDTFLFDDVARLFDGHRDARLYAREEPFSRRSHLGLDARHIDEEALARLAAACGAAPVPPYNCGVVMMNHGLAAEIAALAPVFLEHSVRFLRAPDELPTENRWLVEQVALWLTLGRVAGLTHACLSRDDAIQGDEFESVDRDAFAGVIAHYFSGGTPHFMRWLTAD